MVSIGDDGGGAVLPANDHSTADFPAGDTQPLDSQCFPPSSPGEEGGYDGDDLYMEARKVSFDDTVPVEDVFGTQVVNYGDETQVLDDDDDDLDFLGGTSTQRIDEFSDRVSLDSDGEGTNMTEVLESGDELSDDESGRGGNVEELEGKKFVDQANALSNQKPCSESVPLSSEHLASGKNILRTSGCDETIWASKTGRSIAEEKELENRTKSKVDSSIVRRLFTTDSIAKDGDLCRTSSSIPGEAEEIAPSTTIDEELAGLSYVASQEPGDASQADALAFVDRLIDETKSSFDVEINLGSTVGKKINFVSAAKGPQSLAKKTLKRSIEEKAGIFDWDDRLEDEGGGDIFIRRKDDFLGVKIPLGKSLTNPPKGRLNPQKGNKGNVEVENKVTIQSDSKIAVQKFKVAESKSSGILKNSRKDLLNEFHGQANRTKSTEPPEETPSAPVFPDVGLDTQLAADAMEELLNGNPISDFDGNEEKHSVQQSPIRKAKRRVSSKQHASSDNSEIRVDTRQTKKRKTQLKAADAMEAKEEHSVHKCPIRKAKRRVSSKKCDSNDHYDIGVDTRQSQKRKNQLAGVAPETLDVGLDTQLAADAMETLLHGDPISDFNGKDAKEEHSLRQSPTRKAKRRVSSKQLASNDNSDIGVDTRQSKIRKKNNAKKVDLECDAGPISMTRRRVKSGAAEGSSSCGQKTMEKLSSKTSDPESKGAALRRGRSVKKQHSPEELADHTTIACRTRKSNVVSLSETADSRHADVSEDKDAAREEVLSLEQSPTEALNSEGKTSELTSSKPTKPNNFQSKLTAMTHDISFPRKRRSERNFSEQPKGKESNDEAGTKFAKSSDGDSTRLAEKEVNVITPDNLSKGVASHPSISAAASPLGSVTTTATNAASPVCRGNGLSKKKLDTSSMKRDINNLCSTDPEPISKAKVSRKRRDLADIRVLFSHHLDGNVIKRQKKIVDHLKVPIASSIIYATHFVTDRFVRTRNMLEAIAAGKPVVTPLWLEHVGRAKCYIDEQKYIVRDAKKEKEIGFNLAVSLEHARQHQLLQGRKVLITQNAKPSKEILSGLVKAVHGQPIERVGRSALKDRTLIEDLLVLSSDEDYEVCVPFLERGAAVYGSELLLNGIVTRKLEYDRHRLFLDHVKRTRSTIWVKIDGQNFTPVVKK